MTRRRHQRALLVLSLLAAGCGSGNPMEPLDGGSPLHLGDFDAEHVKGDCLWRREKGGWHYSVGHCLPTGPSQTMRGVWVTSFEESSFLPGRTSIPHPNDPLRFSQDLELDSEKVRQLTGSIRPSRNGDAYLLTFVGRRTRDPYNVDCQGVPYFSFIVDRLVSAMHLGAMGEYRWELDANRPPTVRRLHTGRWGELEAMAIERCADQPQSEKSDGEPDERAG